MRNIETILVIEDNEGDLLLLKSFLEISGYRIQGLMSVTGIESAINLPSAVKPDVIFLDLNLPDSSGLETFLTVNSRFPLSPIIILSGLDDTELALQALQAGAQDYISKNDMTDEKLLRKTVQYSIERKQSQIALRESNQLYQMVSRATNDPVWDWDLRTNEIKWNDKVSIFGYPDQVLKNDDWFVSNIHPDERNRVEQKIQKCLTDGKEKWSDRYRFRCFNGTYKYILDRGYIIRDETGTATRMIGSMEDVTDYMELQQKLLKQKEIRQREILNATISGQEKERNEIGRELHDNVNQMLATVKLLVNSYIENNHTRDPLLEKSLSVTENCIQEIRKMSGSLVHPNSLNNSFEDSIEELVSLLNKTSRLNISLSIPGNISDALTPESQLALYRIIQEQLNNIIKHADAKNIVLKMEGSNPFVLQIEDDGKGFDPQQKSYGIGLQNIKTRAAFINASLQIHSEPGRGCAMKVTVPVQNET